MERDPMASTDNMYGNNSECNPLTGGERQHFGATGLPTFGQ
jgi:hypothetical protein